MCSVKILKNEMRIQYRFKQSRQFSDLGWYHLACARGLPGAAANRGFLEKALAGEALDPMARVQLSELLATIS